MVVTMKIIVFWIAMPCSFKLPEDSEEHITSIFSLLPTSAGFLLGFLCSPEE
jgi:hypothetical protein